MLVIDQSAASQRGAIRWLDREEAVSLSYLYDFLVQSVIKGWLRLHIVGDLWVCKGDCENTIMYPTDPLNMEIER